MGLGYRVSEARALTLPVLVCDDDHDVGVRQVWQARVVDAADGRVKSPAANVQHLDLETENKLDR